MASHPPPSSPSFVQRSSRLQRPHPWFRLGVANLSPIVPKPRQSGKSMHRTRRKPTRSRRRRPKLQASTEADWEGAAGRPSLIEGEVAGDGAADRPSLIEGEVAGDGAADQPCLVEEKRPAPFSDAPSPVRAVLTRPWPAKVVIPPASPSGKFRTLVATRDNIGSPISPEELAALEDKEDDDMPTRIYKEAARENAAMINYIHEHGCLYMDEKGALIVDNSALLEEIRCKNVSAEEMEEKIRKEDMTCGSKYLSELALASYNKRRRVKFELCKPLLCRSFWEDRGFFFHLNFTAKRKGMKKLFFAEVEDCGQRDGEILEVRCCTSLDSVCEGGYYRLVVPTPPRSRKGLDFDRCYACTQFLKHPGDGLAYSGGHDNWKKTYLF